MVFYLYNVLQKKTDILYFILFDVMIKFKQSRILKLIYFIFTAATSKNQNDESKKNTLPLDTLQTQNEIPDLSSKRQSKLVDINNKIGQSTFYDCLEYSPTEKHDPMKPDSDTEEDGK